MAFKEKAKVNDVAQVGIVDRKKYKCPECGLATNDERVFMNHICITPLDNNGDNQYGEK